MDQEALSLKDRILISPFGQWMERNRKLLMNAAAAAVIALAWWGVRSSAAPGIDQIQQVQEIYAAWKAKPEDEAGYRNLQRALEKAPDLRKALRGEIAQVLLVTGKVDEAEKIAIEPLKELREISPLHADFAEISFLIVRKQYQDALEKSVSLKERISEKNSVLYGQNLLRIAFLQQRVDNAAGEMASWRELEEFSARDKNKALAEQALKGLGDQTISFQTYVEERKKSL